MGKETPVLGERCSAVTKVLVWYQRCCSHKPKRSAIWAAVKKINFIPARPSAAIYKVILKNHYCLKFLIFKSEIVKNMALFFKHLKHS